MKQGSQEQEIQEVIQALEWLGQAVEFLAHMGIPPPPDSDIHLHVAWQKCACKNDKIVPNSAS